MKVVEKEEKFDCPLCGESFSSKEELEEHKKSHKKK
jgi:predicted RNA-binding Zn-ribbon protein involved in translation (DUF1610 family)